MRIVDEPATNQLIILFIKIKILDLHEVVFLMQTFEFSLLVLIEIFISIIEKKWMISQWSECSSVSGKALINVIANYKTSISYESVASWPIQFRGHPPACLHCSYCSPHYFTYTRTFGCTKRKKRNSQYTILMLHTQNFIQIFKQVMNSRDSCLSFLLVHLFVVLFFK